MNNVILVDFNTPDNWQFQKALEIATDKKWIVIKSISNLHHGKMFRELVRYLKYFSFAFKIFLKHKSFSAIFAWQQFHGLLLAFYLKIFRIQNAPKIIVMTFIYKPKKGFWGVVYHKFIKYIVTSGYIEKYIVFSNSEKEYYSEIFGIPKEMFVTESLGLEDQYEQYKSDNMCSFFLSVGRSNRDYDFLKEAWNNREKLKIISDTYKGSNTEYIQILSDCHDEQYIKELAKCYAVIIPLNDEKISSGQLVILQAMMFKKPVIVTYNDTVKDYIKSGIDGFIISKDVKSLNDTIKKLKQPQIYNNIAQNARKSFVKNFSLYSMGMRIGQCIKESVF